MNKKHTTRRERQAVRQMVESRVQELEQQQAPRRAALALLKMQQATSNPIVRSPSGEKELILIDDPVQSESIDREESRSWYQRTFASRLDTEKGGRS
jgi:hypothetical protein